MNSAVICIRLGALCACAVALAPEDIRTTGDALLSGGWRTKSQIKRMNRDEKRNTLIVEMENHSNLRTRALQDKNDEQLATMAVAVIFLRDNRYRTKSQLNRMSDDDQRNTMIVEVNKKAGTPVKKLQGMTNQQIARIGNKN